MIRTDPEFAEAYLHTAFEELDEEGGKAGFLIALRHLVDGEGWDDFNIRKNRAFSRKPLSRIIPKWQPNLESHEESDPRNWAFLCRYSVK